MRAANVCAQIAFEKRFQWLRLNWGTLVLFRLTVTVWVIVLWVTF